jgi:hypothetical protein
MEEPFVPFNKEVRNPLLFGHKQEIQLVHGTLSLADGLLHELDAPFGFFDWPLKRIAVLTDHNQQLLA